MRTLRAVAISVVLVATIGATAASACPAPPGWPDEPTVRDMIRSGSTGIDVFPMLLLGRVVVDFPELPWKLQLELLRQAWDEARHAWMAKRRLEVDVQR